MCHPSGVNVAQGGGVTGAVEFEVSLRYAGGIQQQLDTNVHSAVTAMEMKVLR